MSDMFTGQAIPRLFADLITEVTNLIRNEARLAKTEIAEKVDQVKLGVMALLGGAVIMMAGLIILLEAIVIGLTNLGLSPGWAALAVGGTTVLAAILLFVSGASKISPSNLKPQRTMHQLREDQYAVKEAVQ